MNNKYIIIGRKWVKSYFAKVDVLCHYGIKGMKWGVRRTPEQLGHKKRLKKSSSGSIIEKAIREGKISKTINKEKQKRHTKSEHIPGRSYLDGDVAYAQKLVNKLSGTGELVIDRLGNWTRQERVTNAEMIGYYVDNTGVETHSNNAIIVYSKTGTHIYPTRRKEK